MPVSGLIEIMEVMCGGLSLLEVELARYPSESLSILHIALQPVVCMFCQVFTALVKRSLLPR